MRTIIVPRGKFIISDEKDVELQTEPLGAGLAVILYDPELRKGGILVSMVPKSVSYVANSPDVRHGLDTGIVQLFRGFLPQSKRENLNIYLVGAAAFIKTPPQFDIGDQLYRTAIHILSKNNLSVRAEHVRWQFNRVAILRIETGEVIVKLTDTQEIKL